MLAEYKKYTQTTSWSVDKLCRVCIIPQSSPMGKVKSLSWGRPSDRALWWCSFGRRAINTWSMIKVAVTDWSAHLSCRSFWERFCRYTEDELEGCSSWDTSAVHRLQKMSASRWVMLGPGRTALESQFVIASPSTSRLLSSDWPPITS